MYESTICFKSLVLGSVALLTVACNGGSSSSGGNGSPETVSGETDFAVLMAQMQPVEVGELGESLVGSMSGSYLFVGPAGHVVLRSGVLDPVSFDLLSGHHTVFMIKPDGTVEPYLSASIDMPEAVGGSLASSTVPTRHAADAEGAVRTLITVEDNTGDTRELALRYHEGEYHVLFHSDELPDGLEGHELNTDTQSWQGFAVNDSGQSAIRLNMTDSDGDNAFAWVRGDEDVFETLVKWGDSTGQMSSLGLEYEFMWPFIGINHLYPSIGPDGAMRFFANSKTDRDKHTDEEFETLRAIWQVAPDETDVEPVIRARRQILDQSRSVMTELWDIEPNRQVHSPNSHGDITIRNYTQSNDDELWIYRADEDAFYSIALEGVVAPNLDEVGITPGATFQRVGNASLANSGTMTFHAEVESKRSVWISDDDSTRPIAIHGMDAPGLEQTSFNDLGLGGLVETPPLINNQDQIVFSAELYDAAEDRTVDSLWSHDACNGLQLIVAEEQTVELDGVPVLASWEGGEPVIELAGPEQRTINRVDDPAFTSNGRAYGPNAGLPYPLNDDGILVFRARLDGEVSRFSAQEGDEGTFSNQYVTLAAHLPECESGS